MTHADEWLAIAASQAIRTGDVPALERLLAENPGLATARLEDRCGKSRTLLHVATDWPGHFPSVGRTIAALVAAGADVNARFGGRPAAETPLHWAASSNDVEALDALIDAGAQIEAAGAVIAGGSPLADARGFGQWTAAYRLVERGALTTLEDAATLGRMDHLRGYLTAPTAPDQDEITRAFWGACHGGRREAAEYLLARGANLNSIGPGGTTPLDVARQSSAEELVGRIRAQELIEWLRAQGAMPAGGKD